MCRENVAMQDGRKKELDFYMVKLKQERKYRYTQDNKYPDKTKRTYYFPILRATKMKANHKEVEPIESTNYVTNNYEIDYNSENESMEQKLPELGTQYITNNATLEYYNGMVPG